jgi:hypothetical protein
MRRDHQHFNLRAGLAIENVLRKARYSTPPDTGSKFNAKPIWIFTNVNHRCFERREIPSAQSNTLLFVVGDVLEVLDACALTEEVTHFSNAWA